MANLVLAHLLDDLAAAGIVGGQSFQVAMQVAFHLRLGLREEAEAPSVAGHSGCHAEREGSCVPERIQQARTRVEIVEPCPAPREMVALFRRGGLQCDANALIARDERLAAVERLRADLAGVVHAHQARGELAILW